MNSTRDTFYCVYCQQQVTFHPETVDHHKELIRTLCTLGLWLPIWLAKTYSKVNRCDNCNNSLCE